MGEITAVTYLFVPAHEEHKVRKALASAADAVILDLEDAVPPGMKDAAREAAARTALTERPAGAPQLWVRVNGAETAHFARDLEALDWARVDGVVLPKAEQPLAVETLSFAGAFRQMFLVETVAGLSQLTSLAAAARTAPRLALGTWDLARDLNLSGVDDPDDSELIWHVRCELALQSRRLTLDPPIDGIFGRIGDVDGFEAVCERVRRLGFGGKLLIHPEQIAVAARVFGPDADQLREAREIVAAYEEAAREGRGAVRHRGMLIDRVHVERARNLLASSQRSAADRDGRG